MVWGTKALTLFPPSASPHLTSTPLWSESANHSPLDLQDPLVRQRPTLAGVWEERMDFTLQVIDTFCAPAISMDKGWPMVQL